MYMAIDVVKIVNSFDSLDMSMDAETYFDSVKGTVQIPIVNEDSDETYSTCESESQDVIYVQNGSESTVERVSQALKRLTEKNNMKFMENFDPEKSNREKRKLTRKIYHSGSRKPSSAYNDKGVHLTLNIDICDCLAKSCPGCYFPCPKCRSPKCGHECRQNRKWMYDMFEIEGSNTMIKNGLRSKLDNLTL